MLCAHNLSIATMLYKICRYVIVAEYDFVSKYSYATSYYTCFVTHCLSFCYIICLYCCAQGPLGLCLFNKSSSINVKAIDAILMSTHNIGFYDKNYLYIIIKYDQIRTLSLLLKIYNGLQKKVTSFTCKVMKIAK